MNEPHPSEKPLAHVSGEEMTSALFANMIMQQTNMALMFLGRVPHPETGEHIQDLETAQMFIDQLDMLEVKTKGNLDKREEGLLKQSLTAVRMAFVEAVEQKAGPAAPDKKSSGTEPTGPGASETAAAGSSPPNSPVETGPSSEESESRRKFTKKY